MKTETEVYRVERIEDGEGPYRTLMYGNIHNDDYSDVGQFGRHPCPYDDDLLNVSKAHYFGFRDAKALRVWFNETERAYMQREGFHVVVYRVLERLVCHGSRQCCFEKDQATRVRVETLT